MTAARVHVRIMKEERSPSGHIEYCLIMEGARGVMGNSQHRYSDFLHLHGDVKTQLGLGAFPAPKLFNHSRAALQLRRAQLQRFLDEVVDVVSGGQPCPPQFSRFLGLVEGTGGDARAQQDWVSPSAGEVVAAEPTHRGPSAVNSVVH